MITKTWREAATLIIAVKWQANAYRILMLQRSSGSKFMVCIYILYIYILRAQILARTYFGESVIFLILVRINFGESENSFKNLVGYNIKRTKNQFLWFFSSL